MGWYVERQIPTIRRGSFSKQRKDVTRGQAWAPASWNWHDTIVREMRFRQMVSTIDNTGLALRGGWVLKYMPEYVKL